MSSRRVLKAAQAIREVVSMAIISDLKDPRISDVTVTLVEVSPDMRNAKVNVSVMGDETKQKLCVRGLQSSAGYLQQKVGRRIDTRYTPRLLFVLDEGLKHSMIVTRILEEVLPQERQAAEVAAAVEGTEDGSSIEVESPAESVDSTSLETKDSKEAPTQPSAVPVEVVGETIPEAANVSSEEAGQPDQTEDPA
ncbi:MAG: ribosome-binding factor A [Mariniblastus sp.]|jgi:ribosome-binding factor A